MECNRFDILARRLSDAGSSRRQAISLLTGALLGDALGTVAARFGLVESAEAKTKPGRRGGERRRHGAAKSQGQGKRKRKGKGKDKKDDKKHDKKEQHGPCSYQCPGGPCVGEGQCCPGDRQCPPDPDPLSGGVRACVGAQDCCPGEKRCPGGCVWVGREPSRCCPGQKSCGGGVCVAEGECCPGQKRCPGYTECFAAGDCCPAVNPPPCGECESLVCQNGELICRRKTGCCPTGTKVCPGDLCYPVGTCCLGEKKCPDGECISQNACCPNEAPPECGVCEVATCEGGEWWCKDTGQAQCQEGCCPEGYWCHHLGSCCTDGPPFHCTCPSGYCSRNGLCVTSCS